MLSKSASFSSCFLLFSCSFSFRSFKCFFLLSLDFLSSIIDFAMANAASWSILLKYSFLDSPGFRWNLKLVFSLVSDSNLMNQWLISTVEPSVSYHPWCQAYVVAYERWSLMGGGQLRGVPLIAIWLTEVPIRILVRWSLKEEVPV